MQNACTRQTITTNGPLNQVQVAAGELLCHRVHENVGGDGQSAVPLDDSHGARLHKTSTKVAVEPNIQRLSADVNSHRKERLHVSEPVAEDWITIVGLCEDEGRDGKVENLVGGATGEQRDLMWIAGISE